MVIALFILLLLFLLYRIFRTRKVQTSPLSVRPPSVPPPSAGQPAMPQIADLLVPAASVRHGGKQEWVIQNHIRIWQRKTYIRGRLIAKFNGELDYIKDLQAFVRERYFDIVLYDARIEEAEFRKNDEGPFPESLTGVNYPGPIVPNPLPCAVSYQGISGEFEVLLHDIRLTDIDFDKHRLLHMEEDDLVFGTVGATITGYILEHFREEYQKKIPAVEFESEAFKSAVGEPGHGFPAKDLQGEFTGRTRTEENYRWSEFQSLGREATVWRNPVYMGKDRMGCRGVVGFIFLLFFAFVFLSAIGPHGILILLFLLAIGLGVSFFSGLFRPLLWVLAAVLAMIGVASITHRIAHGPDRTAIPFSKDQSNETSFVVRERTVTQDSRASVRFDSLIVHHRVWKDYNDSAYEGDIWVRTSDVAESGGYKNHLLVPRDPIAGYDWMLHALQANDRSLLPGVYKLLDSIRAQHHLDPVAFAKVVVSFVQDIPYALILDHDCNPDLYSDPFIRGYLLTADASCSGFQRFGINTPVEFMGTLKGDCDSRTLLLYTLLDHYGYDVAILSSEVYSHSLLGIVLPVPGAFYPFHGKGYVLWETTTSQMPPGIIARQISNLSNWRISLTSKN
jgi:predicted phage tail protein